MALTISQLSKLDAILKWGWLIGERVEGEAFIIEYEYEGFQYDLYYEYRSCSWTTPIGEIRPCIEKTRLMVGLITKKVE